MRMRQAADRHRRDYSLEIGEKVWLSTKNLPLRGSNSRNLSAVWAGPFEVID